MGEGIVDPLALVEAIIARLPDSISPQGLLALAYLAETRFAAESGRRLTNAIIVRKDPGLASPDLIPGDPDDPRIKTRRASEVTPLPLHVRELIDSLISCFRQLTTPALLDEVTHFGPYPTTLNNKPIEFDDWIAQGTRLNSSHRVRQLIDEVNEFKPPASFENLRGLRRHLRALRGSDDPQ
jgi:hypothetical protein